MCDLYETGVSKLLQHQPQTNRIMSIKSCEQQNDNEK